MTERAAKPAQALERMSDGALTRALERVADLALERARENCPVRTGRLKNSLKREIGAGEAVISANTDYAVYVELGTGKTAPQPFLQNTLFETAARAAEIYREEITRND